RDYFEMWYFGNLNAYKGSAHGDMAFVKKGHEKMDKSLKEIKLKAEKQRALGKIKVDENIIKNIWLKGEYTDFNREHN
ncbi:MAG: hydroxylamine oxidoreductase, partial [Planctomycetes bacterium]|nr:hydroxylamine oxidoreductase [Planctomycetota bacterium]